MKTHSKIFDDESLKAILKGWKTQFRRIAIRNTAFDWKLINTNTGEFESQYGIIYKQKCPYEVGDKLWLKETFARYQTLDIRHPMNGTGRTFDEISDGRVIYKQDGHETIQDAKDHIRLTGDDATMEIIFEKDKWSPPRGMPKWASRIWLEITDIRIERLQDIDELGALSEGIEGERIVKGKLNGIQGEYIEGEARNGFKKYWNLTNKYSWELNPWVWVISFKKVRC